MNKKFINRILFKIGIKTISILGYKFYFENFCFDGKKDQFSTLIVEGFWQINYITIQHFTG